MSCNKYGRLRTAAFIAAILMAVSSLIVFLMKSCEIFGGATRIFVAASYVLGRTWRAAREQASPRQRPATMVHHERRSRSISSSAIDKPPDSLIEISALLGRNPHADTSLANIRGIVFLVPRARMVYRGTVRRSSGRFELRRT